MRSARLKLPTPGLKYRHFPIYYSHTAQTWINARQHHVLVAATQQLSNLDGIRSYPEHFSKTLSDSVTLARAYRNASSFTHKLLGYVPALKSSALSNRQLELVGLTKYRRPELFVESLPAGAPGRR